MAVKGYFGGSTVTGSQVISLTASSSDVVQFANVDIQPHTATDLGTWTGAYPQVTPNPNKTASPANTDISSTKFTTGPINPGSTSLDYKADVPGVYVLGCAFHYNSDNMRTIIIVQ
jgi:plastocyanin